MRGFARLVLLTAVWWPQVSAAGGVDSLLAPGKDWELLGKGYQLTADSAVAKDGTVYVTDARNNRILRINIDGRIAVWKEGSGGAHGIASGPDGRLYAGQHDRKRIVALDPGTDAGGGESIVIEGVQTHHLTIAKDKLVYFSDAPHHTIWVTDGDGTKRAATTSLNWPHGLRVTPDQSRLVVTDTHIRWVWRFPIGRDGSLGKGQAFYRGDAGPGE
jgi:sugar lactone lactonase YvrE